MHNYYQFIIPRLDGEEIRSNFRYYLSLVRKGIAGFIVFGGELAMVRAGLQKLQEEAKLPLIISSDLEQGLGQQITGGTLFPPAMAVASAIKSMQKSNLMTNTFQAMASEARYAGINAIFAPVLDINTNPRNPIISVRAFGEDPETVSFFGSSFIQAVQRLGVAACAKHFPGHGDTETDSHIKLPTIRLDLDRLKRYELQPFQKAMKARVKMVMLGHLNVPALDPSGVPVSLSREAVRFIREEMKYRGILITDALNMGGIGEFSEEEAAHMALEAGVDIILHPTSPDKIASYLEKKGFDANPERIKRFRRGLPGEPGGKKTAFKRNLSLSKRLAQNAIKISEDFKIKKTPFLLILDDNYTDSCDLVSEAKGSAFKQRLMEHFPSMKYKSLHCRSKVQKVAFPENAFVIVALFSAIKAWKGGASRWLEEKLASLKVRADLVVSFGSPYILDDMHGPSSFHGDLSGDLLLKRPSKMFVYWDSDAAQQAAADIIAGKKRLAREMHLNL